MEQGHALAYAFLRLGGAANGVALLCFGIYCMLIGLLVFRSGEVIQVRTAPWRFSGAALMPGALFLTCGILSYGLGWFVHDYRGVTCMSHGGTLTGAKP